ncbi:hypothetical protein QJS04_geneDACA011360 [Acorus gramineus]|uniref:Uncharacterized protein n=1 Tax=Acorus gramineus TaxID=55184 RepID=A0AAV9AMI7_ACOGR|nr:hypothetical protein QJS04_geneDACA011360 [Acorus gramineus]
MFRSSFLRRAKTAFDTFCSSSLINSKSRNIHGVARRFYPTNHFQIVRQHRWFKNHRAVVSSIAVVLGATTIYSQSLETIPYLRRTRFLIVPKRIERKACEWIFDNYKEQHRDEILPSEHPESIRIRRISEEMLEALRSDLREERVWEHSKTSEEEQKKRRKSMIRYLEGLNWEFIVVRDPEVNAMNIAPGKIVILTGLLDRYENAKDEAEQIQYTPRDSSSVHVLQCNSNSFISPPEERIQYTPRDSSSVHCMYLSSFSELDQGFSWIGVVHKIDNVIGGA